MKKFTRNILIVVVVIALVFGGFILGWFTNDATGGNNYSVSPWIDNYKNSDKPVIGIAWQPNKTDAFYINWEYVIQEAGGIPVNLDQILCNDLWYDVHKNLDNSHLGEEGMLNQNAADIIKLDKYDNSNISSVMTGIDGVFFPGGEDISPTLVNGINVQDNICTGFSAARDVSDYLLWNYCIDYNIPSFGVCRGMQMLSCVCNAKIVQDIPEYCKQNNISYDNTHKSNNLDSVIRFTRHDVYLNDEHNKLYDIVKNLKFAAVPSLHHQCVLDVNNTILKETAHADSSDLKVVEAVEIPDKNFILGTQFHPEYVIERVYRENLEDPCNVDTCMNIFRSLVNYAKEYKMSK